MLARPKPIAKIGDILYYNEKKVKAGKAECIYAGNFLKDGADLTQAEKRQRFGDILELNQRAEKKVMHILLQFTPREDFDNRKMIAIAASYMQRISYGDQPYLVYRHADTASPHLHIVSIMIRPDGSSIGQPCMLTRVYRPARTAVEAEFDLVKARANRRDQRQPTGPARAIEYGKLPSEEAIADTLQYVFQNFRYRSITELNAILRLYNLTAITGRPGGRLQRLGGLLYRILDERGVGRGAPIKASDLPSKPTLRWLEMQFAAHRQLDPKAIRNTRLAFDAVLREGLADAGKFYDVLRGNQLALAPDRQPDGSIDGLLLVNLADRVVLNSKELGAGYEYSAIRQRLSFDVLQPGGAPEQTQQEKQQQKRHL